MRDALTTMRDLADQLESCAVQIADTYAVRLQSLPDPGVEIGTLLHNLATAEQEKKTHYRTDWPGTPHVIGSCGALRYDSAGVGFADTRCAKCRDFARVLDLHEQAIRDITKYALALETKRNSEGV